MSDAIKAFAIRGFGAGLAFALQAFLARLMPVAEYGQFVLVWVWTLALGSFASLGLAEMALRVLPRYALRMRARIVADFVSHGFRTTALVATALSALVIAVVALSPLPQNSKLVVYGVGFTLPLLALDFFLGGVSRAMGWFQLGIITTYIVRPLMVILLCAALWFFNVPLTGILVCAVFAICIAATTLFQRVLMHRRLGGHLGKPTSPTLRRFWLKQSAPMLLASGLDDLLGYADVVLVGVLLSPAEAAIYFVASRVLMPASLVQYAFFYVAARRFSLALAGEGKSELRADFWRSTAITVLTCAAALGLTIVAAPWLLRVFGEEFGRGYALLLVLAIAQVLRATTTQAQEYLMVAGKAMAVTWANGIGVVAMLVLAVVLAHSAGAIGIAWALVAALALRSLLLLNSAHNNMKNS